MRDGGNLRTGFGGNIDANVFATLSKRRHGQARIGSAIEDHARRRTWMGSRQVICYGLEYAGTKYGRAVARASEFHRRADGVGLGGRRAGLGKIVDNDRTCGQKRALSVVSRYADTEEIL